MVCSRSLRLRAWSMMQWHVYDHQSPSRDGGFQDPSNRRPIPSEPFPLSNSGFLPIALRTRLLNVPSSTLESRTLCTLVHHSIALSSCSACFSWCSCSTEIIWSPPCILPDSSNLIILTLVRIERRLDVVGQGWLRRHNNTHHVFLTQDV